MKIFFIPFFRDKNISNQGNKTYIVANYYPPGNFLGKYKENILSI